MGSHAFYRDLNFKDTSGFTSLTIPASVESIEEYAFYNHQRMDTVTVQGSNNGGSGQSQLETIGDFAFGTDGTSAPTSSATYKDPVSGITYTYTKGTEFYLPAEVPDTILENGKNCFLGDLTPADLCVHDRSHL